MDTRNSTLEQNPARLLETVDAALHEEDLRRRQASDATAEVPLRFRKLAALLRFIGAVVLIAAAATFLFQRWDTFSHLGRYASFLGFTGILSAAGFFCGLRMKEDKGARTFLAISAAIIPVHFCQLGALLYSRFGTLLPAYPSYANWAAPSDFSAIVTVLGAAAVLLPICLIAFSSLVRSEAVKLTGIYLLANSFLLIPTRDGNMIACLALALFVMLLAHEVRDYHQSLPMQTKEGIFVRVMMAVPLLFMIGRSFHLYSLTTLLDGTIAGGIAALMFVLLPRLFPKYGKQLQAVSTIPAAMAWGILMDLLPAAVQGNTAYTGIPFAAVLLLMGEFAISGGKGFRVAAGFVAIGSTLLQMGVQPDLTTSFVCMIISVVCISTGFLYRIKEGMVSGVFGFVVALGYQIRFAIAHHLINPWIGLAILGIVIVLSSSYIEKNCKVLIERLGMLRERARK